MDTWPRIRFLFVAMLVVIVFASIGCASSAGSGGNGDRLRIVTDVPPITSIVENIGGDRIELRGMIPQGVSSHGFEPPPRDIVHLADADLHIFNGLHLAAGLYGQAETNRRASAVTLYVGEVTLTRDEWVFDSDFPEAEGNPNPHIWMDPIRALRYAQLVHHQLVALDRANRDYYAENLRRFEEKVLDLDRRAREAAATIQPEHRRLLTYHDCCPYMAERYGIEVIAAIQPSDFGEPSAQEVASIINQVRDLGLPAIFGSQMFPSPVMEQIARESGAEFVDGLEDDELPGQPGDPEHSYFGMMLENFRVVVAGLGGSTEAFDGFDPGPVFDGASGAVY